MNETKKCGKSGVEKSLGEYYVRRLKKSTILQPNCIDCTKKYHIEHYAANKEKYFRNKRIWKKSAYEKINTLKSAPCTDCKNTFPPEAMDFDHIEDNKEYSIAKLVSSNSMTKALLEIAKCELVCANCHRIRTKKRYAGLTE